MANASKDRTYLREFFGAMIAYAALLYASNAILSANPSAPWRFAVAVLPMIPALVLMRAVINAISRLDELQQNIQFTALGFAFAGTAAITFTYGFLENVGVPQLSWIYVWPLMATLWIVGRVIASRKYG